MKAPFLFCAVYGLALSVLVLSSVVTSAAVDLFVASPYSTGTHQQDWMNWHALGCFFVGLVNLRAWRWGDTKPRRDAAVATALVFGGWAVLNLRLMFTGRFLAPMWLHVIGCAAAAGWSAAWAAREGRHLG